MFPFTQSFWNYPNAIVDLDFRKRRWYGGYVDERPTSEEKGSLLSCGGGYFQTAYTPRLNGTLQVQGSAGSQNRITDWGFFQERASTNFCLWSRDLTNAAWDTKTNVTVAKDQTGADGVANACSSVLATAANAIITQSITRAINNFIVSFYIKRLIGSGTLEMTADGGATWIDVSSQLTSKLTTSGWCWIQIPLQNLANPVMGMRIGTSGDKFAVDMSQGESGPLVGAMATTPMPCTTTTQARLNEVSYFTKSTGVSTGNAGQRLITDLFSSGAPWWFIISFNGDCTNNAGSGPGLVVTDLTNPSDISGGGGSTLLGSASPGNNGRGNWNKAVVRCNYAGTTASLNGQAIGAGNANKPNLNVGGTHFNIGNNGSGTTNHPLNGSIGRFTGGVGELTDIQMMTYSDLFNAIDPYP